QRGHAFAPLAARSTRATDGDAGDRLPAFLVPTRNGNFGGPPDDLSVPSAPPCRSFRRGVPRHPGDIWASAGAKIQGSLGEDARWPDNLGAGLGESKWARNPLHPRLLPNSFILDQAGHQQRPRQKIPYGDLRPPRPRQFGQATRTRAL